MPRPSIQWSDDLDATLEGLRAAGLTWEDVAAAMSLSRNAVLERARKTGVVGRHRCARQLRADARKVLAASAANRGALKAGDATSWDVLNALLSSAPLPFEGRALCRPLHTCRWGFGDPKVAGFRFCDAPSSPGFSFCAEHMLAAYDWHPAFHDTAQPARVAA
jgi:hypothetical protein